MFKQRTYHVLVVTTVLRQTNLVAELHIGFASKYHSVILPDFVSIILFQCVNCVWFVTKHIFINLVNKNVIRS